MKHTAQKPVNPVNTDHTHSGSAVVNAFRLSPYCFVPVLLSRKVPAKALLSRIGQQHTLWRCSSNLLYTTISVLYRLSALRGVAEQSVMARCAHIRIMLSNFAGILHQSHGAAFMTGLTASLSTGRLPLASLVQAGISASGRRCRAVSAVLLMR